MQVVVAIQDESMTAYTIFCAEGQPSCFLSADAPFVFTEGPRSFKYTGVAEPTLYVNVFVHFTFHATSFPFFLFLSAIDPVPTKQGLTLPLPP